MGLMKFGIKSLFKIIVPLVVVAGALFYFGQGLQDASLEDFELTGIDEITKESFTIIGNLFVKNPSELSVPIDSIDYDVFLKKTGEKIGSGNLPSFTLEKEKVSQIEFNQEIKWIPTAQLAADLLTEDEVYIEVKGKLKINLPKVKEYSIPFSHEVDIKDYIKQFVGLPINDELPINEGLPGDMPSDIPNKESPIFNDDKSNDDKLNDGENSSVVEGITGALN